MGRQPYMDIDDYDSVIAGARSGAEQKVLVSFLNLVKKLSSHSLD